MSDTLSFASRLCKFVILLVILLIGGASLFLWWLGRPYQDAMSAFVPLLMPMLVLVLAFDTFRPSPERGARRQRGSAVFPSFYPASSGRRRVFAGKRLNWVRFPDLSCFRGEAVLA